MSPLGTEQSVAQGFSVPESSAINKIEEAITVFAKGKYTKSANLPILRNEYENLSAYLVLRAVLETYPPTPTPSISLIHIWTLHSAK